MTASGMTTHIAVTLVYLVVSVASVVAATHFPTREDLKAAFVALDAILVAVILHEHILASPITDNHNLTTSSLVVAFVLLNHVALKLDQRLILLFSTIVVISWSSILAIMAYRHHAKAPGSIFSNFFNRDLALTISFAFTSLAVFLLARDHDHARRQAIKGEERRMNLSRFFSPTVVSDLQDASANLELERRNAAVMFVDIRDFTSYAELATARELARVLAEYRRIVAGSVVAHGGMVDKFMGDGVMAVFGQPKPLPDDTDRALACAIDLASALDRWRVANASTGGPFLEVGIGLHCGTVIGGDLESGFHDKFTVIDDVVNVAQRLEGLAKSLKAPLVVSEALLQEVPGEAQNSRWLRATNVKLAGRRETIDMAFLQSAIPMPLETPTSYEIGERQTDP
jgi:adenylate cyclase